MIAACGATHVGYAEDWDMLVVGDDPSRRALARAAREGSRSSARPTSRPCTASSSATASGVDATSADALERARAEARSLEAQRRTVLSPRQVQDVASRLADVAKERQTGDGSGGMHGPTSGRRHAA